ncbi:MAG: thiamine pyrophosphate-dependent dehydrogenase E1 component subunit alpha [Chloroflexi bacterium]|nr:thiamine pyrophosphate-dependent dehydrogenase E1 component subunit alpha [Chloroflexota bacterium]
MYEAMLLARLLDERQWILNRQGLQAFHISCQGHEASGVGSAFALDPERDVMVPYYRSLGAVVAFGVTPRDVFLSALAKADDPMTGGRQMPAHYGLASRRILTSGSPVATQIPHATGAALASKIRGDGGVSIVYFGDGASSKGDFHEGLNFAAIHKLPAIFVCENNHYAISVPTSKQMAVRSVAERAMGYGMFGASVDGTDPLVVYRAVKEAADNARAGKGPSLIESNVPRLTPHSSDDDDRRYRPEQERRELPQHDPLRVFGEYLHRHGLLSDEEEAEIRDRLRTEVDAALEEALAAAAPDASTAFDHVYADRRMPGLPTRSAPRKATL